MRYAKYSNGTTVVVKLLYSGSDELWILQCLHSIKSLIKPTIPLLGMIKLNIGMFVILPEATSLDHMFRNEDFANEGKILDLSYQLIGVATFLHRCGITYLDIKPQNIVVLGN